MKKIKNQKKREALIRYWHGENWTDEDQKEFERERNRRQCLTHRNKHREEYTDYQREYQRKYRERNKHHYGWVQWNRLHPDNKMTEEQYIEYRKNKEEKKEQDK
jgi:hypothetical protein